MPTVITFLLAPICLILAMYRLIAIPLQMHRGQRRLNTTPSVAPALWAGVAYCALLGYLVWLGARMYTGLVQHPIDAAEFIRLVLCFEAFPLVYVLAESRFFYGFARERNARPRLQACGESA